MSIPMPPKGLLDQVRRLKHDLGKYISLNTRWLPADARPQALREALRCDLLETRKADHRLENAWQIWERLGLPLLEAGTIAGDESVARWQSLLEPELARVATHMESIRQLIPLLDMASPGQLRRGAQAAIAVSRLLARLQKRIHLQVIQQEDSP